MYFGHYSLRKTWVLECIARLALEHLLAVNMLTGPKHLRNPPKGTFILRFHHSDIDKAGKRPF